MGETSDQKATNASAPAAATIPLDYRGTATVGPRATTGLVALIVAAAAVGFAIQIQDGEYTPLALLLISVALACAVIAIVWPHGWRLPVARPSRPCEEGFGPTGGRLNQPHCAPTAGRAVPQGGVLSSETGLNLLIATAIALQLVALFVTWPGVDLPRRGGSFMAPFYAGLVAEALLVVRILTSRLSLSRRMWFPLLLSSWALLAGWMIFSSPRPFIDVWVFQQDGARALLDGKDPYAVDFPDIYHSTEPGHQQVYGTGLVENGRVKFGFPYPPVSLLLATAGYAAAGDHRYAQAAALLLAGLFIGYSRKSRVALLAAALLLFTPRIFFVLGRGWTEPFGVMLLAATIFFACRRSRWLALPLGLFLATKQYLVVALPLTFFLLPKGWRWRDWAKLLAQSVLVAAAATLPLALWNWHAFWKSTVTVQELAPFRWDALSYLVWWGFHGHGNVVTRPGASVVASGVAALAALALIFWKAPRTPAGFAAALALLCLAFFSFNKQAFCNYYFFVIAALCCAAAAWEIGGAGDEPSPACSPRLRGTSRGPDEGPL